MSRDLTVPILFYVTNPDKTVVDGFNAAVDRLVACRGWMPSEPTLVDETETASDPGDADVRTMGIQLDVINVKTSDGSAIHKVTDHQQFDNFRTVLDVVSGISKDHRVRVAVCYNHEHVGNIIDGIPDRSVDLGLLKPWRAAVTSE